MNRKAVSGIVLMLLLTSMLSSAFVIQPVRASGTIYIRADGTVDPPTAPIQRDGDIYTFTDNIYDSIVVERGNIVIDGAGYTVQGTGAWNSTGIDLSGRSNVTIKNMEVKAFWNGIGLWNSLNNRIYHNNFVNNTNQVYSLVSVNIWDDGYPSGGNYWSDYIDVDQYSGPYQNETGSDGIWDHPYVIDENNQDNYPIVARGRAYDGIYFPLGDRSFADEVVDFKPGRDTVSPYNNPQSAVGPPDWPPITPDGKNYVALGHGGILTIKFTDNYLIDVDGADLYVFEIGETEPFKVEISEDGSNWIDLGTVKGQPTSLDIHGKVAPTDEFRYVRITDAKSYMSPYPYAGADIDAVGAIGAKTRVPPPPQVTVLSPNGGETWWGVQNITWNATSPEGFALTIRIDLYDGYSYRIIADGLENTGSYEWNTTSYADGSSVSDGYYNVRVTATDTYGGITSDLSDDWFMIANRHEVAVSAPLDQKTIEGENATYILSIRNRQPFEDTFDLSLQNLNDAAVDV
jgi:hypothetical protein